MVTFTSSEAITCGSKQVYRRSSNLYAKFWHPKMVVNLPNLTLLTLWSNGLFSFCYWTIMLCKKLRFEWSSFGQDQFGRLYRCFFSRTWSVFIGAGFKACMCWLSDGSRLIDNGQLISIGWSWTCRVVRSWDLLEKYLAPREEVLILCLTMIPRFPVFHEILPFELKKKSFLGLCDHDKIWTEASFCSTQVPSEPREQPATPFCRLHLPRLPWTTGLTSSPREGAGATWSCQVDHPVDQTCRAGQADPVVERVPDDRQEDLRKHLSQDHRWPLSDQ